MAARLAEFGEVEVTLVEVDSAGDLDRSSPVAALTEMGAFVRSVQAAVLDGRADAAVHSLKDLPTAPVPGLVAAAFPERADPRDCLVGRALGDLRAGSRVGTGSPRRAAQMRVLRPDLEMVELRGNVDTRIRRVAEGEVEAAVLALAGLWRLGREDAVAEVFGVDRMVPAPGQGTLVVEAGEGSPAAGLLGRIDGPEIRMAVEAERGLLAEAGAGCRSALGAFAELHGGRLRMDAFVEDDRGRRRSTVSGDHPDEVVAAARKELGL